MYVCIDFFIRKGLYPFILSLVAEINRKLHKIRRRLGDLLQIQTNVVSENEKERKTGTLPKFVLY